MGSSQIAKPGIAPGTMSLDLACGVIRYTTIDETNLHWINSDDLCPVPCYRRHAFLAE
jgi:hypothetical protein